MGQIVSQNIDKGKLDSGSHTIKVPVESLSKGVYLARIKINDKVFVKKVIIKINFKRNDGYQLNTL